MSPHGGLQDAEPKSGWNWDLLAVLFAVVPLTVVALVIGAQQYEQRERAREEATIAFMGTVEDAVWESCLTANGSFPSDIGASPSDSGITNFLPDHTLGENPYTGQRTEPRLGPPPKNPKPGTVWYTPIKDVQGTVLDYRIECAGRNGLLSTARDSRAS